MRTSKFDVYSFDIKSQNVIKFILSLVFSINEISFLICSYKYILTNISVLSYLRLLWLFHRVSCHQKQAKTEYGDPIVAPFIAFITDLSFAVGNLAKVSQFLRYAMHFIYILELQSEPLSEPIWLIDRAVALPRFIFPKKCLFILTRSACISDCRGKSNKKSAAYFRKHSCDLPLF